MRLTAAQNTDDEARPESTGSRMCPTEKRYPAQITRNAARTAIAIILKRSGGKRRVEMAYRARIATEHIGTIRKEENFASSARATATPSRMLPRRSGRSSQHVSR